MGIRCLSEPSVTDLVLSQARTTLRQVKILDLAKLALLPMLSLLG